MKIMTIHNPKPTRPSHGEIANTTPPDVETPLPPEAWRDNAKLNFVLNNLII
jgi:hypothetical protein